MIRKGDRIFFADNSKNYLERCDVFARTVLGLGLVPVFYGGAGAAVRRSNQDRAMRDDFYGAKAVVLYFGAPKDSSNHEDHWVLPEIKHRIAGVDCLLYLSEDFLLSVLQNHGYVGQPRVLSDGEDFGAALQNDLQKLMGHDT